MSDSKLARAFAQWLIKTRDEQGVSTRELATRTGLHATAISYIENNKSDVRMTTFVAIAKALSQCPAALLLQLTAVKTRKPVSVR